MSNDVDLGLHRLFDAMPEPEPDEAFVKAVVSRIDRFRYGRWIVRSLLLAAAVIAIVASKPLLIALIGFATAGINLLSFGAIGVLFSPVGWIVGGALALPLFLRAIGGRP